MKLIHDTEYKMRGLYSAFQENKMEYIKHKLCQLWNILTGKDKNWDGSVDIKDKMIEAESKAKDDQNNKSM